MDKKNTNQGFSLVELLVAVAILAVIVTPFLMAFLTTTNINANTKKQQRAKFAATNVMEDIRSVDVEDIIGVTKIDDNRNEDGGYNYPSAVDENGIPTGAKAIASVYPQDDGTYLYKTTQITDKDEEYTVDATLDPRYTTASDKDESTDYNAYLMAHIKGMNSSYDTYYELDANTDNNKFEQLSEKLLGSRDEDTLRSVYDTVNREIVINITNHSINGNNTGNGVDVTVQSFYTMPNGGQIEEVMTQPQVIYAASGDTLEGIYLFYNPLYNGTFWRAKETITINNSINYNCDVYLVRQDWPEGSDAYRNFPFIEYCHYDRNKSRNDNYRVNVRLKENRAESAIGSGDNINVITNVKSNVVEEDDKGNIDISHLTLTYANNGDSNYDSKCGNVSAADIMGIKGLSSLEATDSVYRVLVEAYQLNGKGERINYAKVESTTQ